MGSILSFRFCPNSTSTTSSDEGNSQQGNSGDPERARPEHDTPVFSSRGWPNTLTATKRKADDNPEGCGATCPAKRLCSCATTNGSQEDKDLCDCIVDCVNRAFQPYFDALEIEKNLKEVVEQRERRYSSRQ